MMIDVVTVNCMRRRNRMQQHHRPIPDSETERESARLSALERYDILGTPPEASFDRITRLTKKLFAVPIAIVSFIDGHRQWYKSWVGLADNEVPKEQTFCQHVVADGKPLIVPDATKDPRFRQHPFVLDMPHVRFYAGIPLRTEDGHNIGVLCIIDTSPREFDAAEIEVMEDLAQMAMGALELRRTADKDTLTGAVSRRVFKEEVNHAATLALRHHHDLSVIAIDLDHFKSINDTYGHAAGDVVLQRTVQTCGGQLRSTDLIGRLGGEEFTVLLPNTGQMGAVQAAEKMRSAVEQQRVIFQHQVIKLTASFGIASLDYQVRDVDTLLECADKALYSAKAEGRNRCACLGEATKLDPSRRRVLKAGQILFNGRRSTMNCTVRFLSDQGAGLDIINSAGLPSRFDLIIRADGFDSPCRVLSQSQKHIDVAFC
jgi:diguanylate cyclase (GGDEF)-like protein